MGLFSKAFKKVFKAVTAPTRAIVSAVQAVKAEAGRFGGNVGSIVAEAAPLVAAFAPGPIGAIARFAIAQQQGVPPPPFVPGAFGQPLGLAGFAAQERRTTFGPQFQAAQPQFPFSLPQRSQFPFQPQRAAGFGGFSAPFQAQNFFSGSSGFRGAARSPFAFGGQNFQRRSFVGAQFPQLHAPAAGFAPFQQTFAPTPRPQFQQFARPAFGRFGGFRSFF